MNRLITCAECGKTFSPTAPNQQYCSQACRDNANSTTCLHCGKLFIAHDSQTLFCSRLCYDQYRNKQKRKAQVKGKPLSEWQREAAECNLDYGTYRGLIAAGKSFEELKAQAAFRNLPTHNHASYGFLSRQRSF
ncbi:MAG: hypothetical protein IJP68_07410 [Selenomonadaceae bacterium]|nr:hypothetical protein [Selenomonadaceae bacterium]